MSFPGYKKPTDLLINAGVFYARDDDDNFIPVGVTRGGIGFKPGHVTHHPEFDGKTSDIEGLHRITGYESEFSGTFIDLSLSQMGRLAPGSTADDSGSSNIVIPIKATEFFAVGAYIRDLLWISRTLDNNRIRLVGFPRALVMSADYKSQPNNETECTVVIKAVIPEDATDINECPYREFEANSIDDLDAIFPTFWNIDGYVG